MFGDNSMNLGKSKFMSVMLSSLLFISTSATADQQSILNEIKKEIKQDGLSYSVEVIEHYDTKKEMESLYLGVQSAQLKQMIPIYKQLADIMSSLGFSDIDGKGSSIVKQGNFFDCDNFYHLKPDHENNILWKCLGNNTDPLQTLNLLPSNTVFSATANLDAVALLTFIRKTAATLNFPGEDDIGLKLTEFEKMATDMGMPLDEFAKSLSTEVSLFVTVSKDKKMSLPDMPPLPQTAISLIIKKKSDFLQTLLTNLANNAPHKKGKVENFDVVVINDPLPIGTKAGFAYDKDYLVISTDIEIIKSINQAKIGKGLMANLNFAPFAKMPQTGSIALYLNGELSNHISEILKASPEELSFTLKTLSISYLDNKNPEFFAILSKKSNGLKIDALSSINPNKFQVDSLTLIAVVGVLAAMILPALGKARSKAKQAKNKSNLRGMSMAVATYFSDGVESKYPTDWGKIGFDEGLFTHSETGKTATLKDFVAGKADFIPLFKSGQEYTGSATTPIAMERPGIRKDGSVAVAFEDGHVEIFYGKTVEEVLNNIKKQYGE